MGLSRSKSKGRRNGQTFLAIPHRLLNHENYHSLSLKAKAMMIELGSQYNGKNNGDLCATRKTLEPRGWKSNDVITSSLKELANLGFIILTRQGGRKTPNLYAITWQPINYCGGKLDVPETKTALNHWADKNRIIAPPDGSKCTATRCKKPEKVIPLHRHTVQKRPF